MKIALKNDVLSKNVFIFVSRIKIYNQ